jgi:4-amino-4-deoxy-L-arabinose transferase-like glycosyltransferase
MYGSLAGVVAALLLCGYPLLFYVSGVLVPQVLGTFLLLLAIHLVLSERGSAIVRYSAAGVAWGVQILASPSFMFAVPIFVIWPFVTRRSARSVGMSAAFLIGAAVVILPWTARNYQVFEKFVLVSTNSGWNLLLGNNELTTPSVGAWVVPPGYDDLQKGLDEVQRDSLYSRLAMEYIKNNKMQSLKMYVLKLANYFHVTDEVSGGKEPTRFQYLVLIGTYGALLLLACARLITAGRLRLHPGEILVLCIYLCSALFFSLYLTRVRFRVPFDPLLMVVDAAFLAYVIRQVADSLSAKEERILVEERQSVQQER